MNSPKRRVLIPLISDTHSGLENGLISPKTYFWKRDALGNSYKYKPALTETNKHLYNCFIEGLDKTVKLADGDEIVPFFLGDHTNGAKYPIELLTSRYNDQLVAALDTLGIVCKMPNVKRIVFAFGTGSHSGGQGSTEELLARILGKNYGIEVGFTYHGVATVADCDIDYAHHGPGSGIRQWTKGNVARFYLTSEVNDDLQFFRKPSRVYVRGHYHVKVIEHRQLGEKWYTIIVAPPFVMSGDFATQVTHSTDYRVTNGIITLEIVDGDLYKVHEFTKTVDMRTREII